MPQPSAQRAVTGSVETGRGRATTAWWTRWWTAVVVVVGATDVVVVGASVLVVVEEDSGEGGAGGVGSWVSAATAWTISRGGQRQTGDAHVAADGRARRNSLRDDARASVRRRAGDPGRRALVERELQCRVDWLAERGREGGRRHTAGPGVEAEEPRRPARLL